LEDSRKRSAFHRRRISGRLEPKASIQYSCMDSILASGGRIGSSLVGKVCAFLVFGSPDEVAPKANLNLLGLTAL